MKSPSQACLNEVSEIKQKIRRRRIDMIVLKLSPRGS
jgi:hypothetical protein